MERNTTVVERPNVEALDPRIARTASLYLSDRLLLRLDERKSSNALSIAKARGKGTGCARS